MTEARTANKGFGKKLADSTQPQLLFLLGFGSGLECVTNEKD